jgi:hypothetical protein
LPDEVMDVQADSSTATAETQAPTGQAPSTPEQAPQTQPQDRTIPLSAHIRERQGWQREREQMRAELQKYTTLQQKQDSGQQLSPEQEIQLRQAAGALKQILCQDNDLKALLDLAKHAPKLMQGYEGVNQLRETHSRGNATRAISHIGELAKSAGLPTDPQSLQRLGRFVVVEAQTLPDADARFDAGDFSVLTDAFNAIKGQFIAPQQRVAQQTLGQTKLTTTTGIPPRGTNGGPPGPSAPRQFGPGQEREQRADLHERAVAMARERQG